MRFRRRIAISVITFGILIGSAGIANATVTPTPTGNDNSVSFDSTGFPGIPTPTPFPRHRFCRVEFDRLFIPTVNPFTGLPVRAGQWDRICFSRFGGVTVTPLTPPIVF